jgi:lipid A 4'-phosphatase
MRFWTLPILVGLTLATGAVFAVLPQIDISTAAFFHTASGFPAAHNRVWETARRIFYWTPTVALVCSAALWLLKWLGIRSNGPSARALAFLVATFALAPGLLVNVVLKDHSHRPRPIQVAQFGGPDSFRPWYRFDGACRKNCSFASGEASAGFWTVAPAVLMPAPIRAAAVVAAFLFGTATALLRLAFGGHFLSDVVLSALLTLTVVVAMGQWFGILSPPEKRRRERSPSPTDDLHERQQPGELHRPSLFAESAKPGPP